MQEERNKAGTEKNPENEQTSEKKQETEAKINEIAEDLDSLKEALEAARKESADNYERLIRVSADFDNYKKRVQRQMDEYRKYSNAELIRDLLPVVDNLERAIAAYQDNRAANIEACMAEGVEMTLKGILDVLEKYNAVPVEAQGKPFDPNYHEAVMQEASEQYPENTVINELQKGYLLHDRLIRPSMVAVSKGRPGNSS